MVRWTGVNVWRPLDCSYEDEQEVGSLEINAGLVSTVLQVNTALLMTQQKFTYTVQSSMHLVSEPDP